MERVGFYRVLTDDEESLIHYSSPGMEINLGAVGKGYAIDEAAETLRFWGAQNAVIHGGQSTIYALGDAPTEDGGRRTGDGLQDSALDVILRRGDEGSAVGSDMLRTSTDPSSSLLRMTSKADRSKRRGWEFVIRDPRDHVTPLQNVTLRDEALSTSGNYEQYFEHEGVRYSHIIDPVTGRPTQGMISVSVITPSAADSDALSTAFFVLGREATEEYCRHHPNIRVVMVEEAPNAEIAVSKFGFED